MKNQPLAAANKSHVIMLEGDVSVVLIKEDENGEHDYSPLAKALASQACEKMKAKRAELKQLLKRV